MNSDQAEFCGGTPQSQFLNVAAYKFVPLTDLFERREQLRELARRLGLKGTILLSPEGINLFVAGLSADVRQLLDTLTSDKEIGSLEVKESTSDTQPFSRMLVKVKKEIIAFGMPDIDPVNAPAKKISPTELKSWLDEGKPCLLLDVRNDYEVGLGTFENAKPIGVDHFRNFPTAVEKLPPETKAQPIVMFCTGGIRCEKAGPFMQQAGFREVYQLSGGILKYFEECGNEHYNGECFVFDKRVALDANLQETDTEMCFVCQELLSKEDQQSPDYIIGEQCPYCCKKSVDLATPREPSDRGIGHSN
ncbi:oxygen-dependent tRNA uridine(34) hydroxylase TrhO [Bythopirellula goksoeyrii]|uniref:tRNA uridine(34) hydroxylase n=1 Tax=Bythopirellula goksoeyrii TaxID=1400387 RepID=A0A5B9Q1A3_9BACT|nr:rhodanese-like domain-containing protein [Bythopirellula goksoeyrii]QEG32827.1 putative adenylyltransferase/sulfurtransferase MoeZ [Bythopirellula goksoeyrii]